MERERERETVDEDFEERERRDLPEGRNVVARLDTEGGGLWCVS